MCHEAFWLGVCVVANYAFYKTAYLSHKYIIISFLKNTIRHWNTFSAFSFVHNITGSLELPTGKGKHNVETTGFLARSFQKPKLQIHELALPVLWTWASAFFLLTIVAISEEDFFLLLAMGVTLKIPDWYFIVECLPLFLQQMIAMCNALSWCC